MLDALPVLQLLLCLCAESSEHANAPDPQGCLWLEVHIMLLEHFVSFELWERAFEETTKDMPRQRVARRVWETGTSAASSAQGQHQLPWRGSVCGMCASAWWRGVVTAFP